MKSLSLQAVMELRESTEGLKNAVVSLSWQVERQQADIVRMTRALWVAGGALLVLGPMIVWLIDHRFGEVLNAPARTGA